MVSNVKRPGLLPVYLIYTKKKFVKQNYPKWVYPKRVVFGGLSEGPIRDYSKAKLHLAEALFCLVLQLGEQLDIL
jgi:hypothetical protein